MDLAASDQFAEELGPYYDEDGARNQLGRITREELTRLRLGHQVLAVGSDRKWLYPAWQFSGHGSIHPQLVPVIAALRPITAGLPQCGSVRRTLIWPGTHPARFCATGRTTHGMRS